MAEEVKTEKAKEANGKSTTRRRKARLQIDREAIKKFNLVAVAFSHVEREWFATEDAYLAEKEVEDRAQEVIEKMKELGINAKGYPSDQYFLTNLLVDKPDLVLNLVDTLKGRDKLQTSVPAALELSNIPYTGAGMDGMVIGNDRNLTKRLLLGYDIPTPPFQFIRRAGTSIDEEVLTPPLIVKLNESGGSVGIDNHAVKETIKDAQKKVDEMISTYKIPVVVEKFVDGPEITVAVFDDGQKKHVFMGEKVFRKKPDGKHYFTSLESYEDLKAYTYKPIEEPLRSKVERLGVRAFNGLYHRDYAKFDIRVGDAQTPYFTDSNPNTAFGPDMGLPFTEVLAMYGISFDDVLASLLSRYAKELN